MGRFSGVYAKEKAIARIYDNFCPYCGKIIYNYNKEIEFHHPDECNLRPEKAPSIIEEVCRRETLENKIIFKISRLNSRYEISKEALHLLFCYAKAFLQFKKIKK